VTPAMPPDAICAAALAGLPGMGPATLTALLERSQPVAVWRAVLDGEVVRRRRPRSDLPALPLDGRDLAAGPQTWQGAARSCDLAGLERRVAASGIGVTWRGERQYPAALVDDPEPPGVLFWRGDLGALARPCVAIVGTRHCSPDGRRVAYELGRDLAGGGMCVVSGLALGIDGGAHRGALAAGVGAAAGVAASGVDVAYPRQHAALWEEVADRGVVVSETAPGRPAQAWRFPARNRVIAGLVRVVVVVESHEAGGSMLTVDAALARGIDVGAVPGPVHSPASAGTNRLLIEGATPIRHAGDVLDGLGLVAAAASDARARRAAAEIAELGGVERRTYEAVGWAPTGLSRIIERADLEVGAVGRALAALEHRGLVEGRAGWWVRRSPGCETGKSTHA
jgi:DNA processing protein